MPKCAFLTLENQEGWFVDDEHALPALRSMGWEVEEVVWSKPIDWRRFDVVVVRSPWDYQQRLPQFMATLEAIHASNTLLLNPLDLIRWNVDKRYLLDLQNRGVEIVPTVVLHSPTPKSLRTIFAQSEADQFVSKPTIGATADDTFRLHSAMRDGELSAVCELYRDKPCLIQPFMPGIIGEGEYSLMYFNGALSHVILKTVGAGDFRVQEEHGGGVEAVPGPSEDLVAASQRVMQALAEPTLYARVDVVRTDLDRFALMELELIEPCLYFRFGADSPVAFAEAVHAWHERSIRQSKPRPDAPLSRRF